jgi:hypothetical protein
MKPMISIDPEIVAAINKEDRQWFEQHPGHTWYIRRARDGECNVPARWVIVFDDGRPRPVVAAIHVRYSDAEVEYMATHGTMQLTLGGPVWLPDVAKGEFIQ